MEEKYWRRHASKLLSIVIVIALFSCSTEKLALKTDRNISIEKLERIQIGITKKSEIEEIFGPPLDKITLQNREQYFYKDFNLDALRVVFDSKGIVSGYYSNY